MWLAIIIGAVFGLGLLVGAVNGYSVGWGWGWIGHIEGDTDPWEQFHRLRRERTNTRASG